EEAVKESKAGKMSKMTTKLTVLLSLYLYVGNALPLICRSRGQAHSNGEVWAEGSFKKLCTVTGNEWSVKIIACLTLKDTEVGIGQTLNEGRRRYMCEDQGGGKVGMRYELI
ncbi:hypothetical protein GCK32_005878, partial [Trichostrongylus colubriformis]